MATKRSKGSGGKTRAKSAAKPAARRPATSGGDRRRGDERRTRAGSSATGGGGAPVARTPERRPAAIAPAGGGRTGASVFSAERARALQDAIQRSKLTAADPWGYTSKARKWETRARELAERLARDGESASLRQALDALSAEVERDRDFQEARRLF